MLKPFLEVKRLTYKFEILKELHILVVATPGRLLDLIEKGSVNIKNIKTLVLDEADEMLSMGFKEDLNKILNYTKGTRHTWLFSATMPEGVLRIIKSYMDENAHKIEVNKDALVNANISHQYIITSIVKINQLPYISCWNQTR